MTVEEGRPRGARHFLTGTGAGYISKMSAIVVGIATLPIGIGEYGAGVFGVWITATSLTQYLSSGGVGMPLAVMTAVASAPDREGAARIGAHGLRVATLGSLVLVAVATAVWLIVPGWALALFGEEGGIPHVFAGVVVLLVGTAILQPLQIYANIQAGRHRIVARNVYDAVRTLGQLGALLLAVSYSGSLLVLASVTVAADAAVAIVRATHITISERIPVHRHVLDRGARHDGLVSSGMRFLTLQVEATIIRNTDNLVINSLIGASAVSYYAAPHRIVAAATALIESMQGPLWPAYGAARRDGDWRWIARTHERVIGVGLTLGGLAWIGTTGFGIPVIELWLGPDFPVDPVVLFALGAYAFIATWVSANAILLNALDATRSQVVSGAAEAIVNVGSSIALAIAFGTAGVAAGTTIGAACVSSWYLPMDVSRQTDGRVSPRIGTLMVGAGFTVPLAVLTLWATTSLEGVGRYGLTAVAIVGHLTASALLFREELSELRSLRSPK